MTNLLNTTGVENPSSKVIFKEVIDKHEKLSKILIIYANFTTICIALPIFIATFCRIFNRELDSKDYELPLPVW